MRFAWLWQRLTGGTAPVLYLRVPQAGEMVAGREFEPPTFTL